MFIAMPDPVPATVRKTRLEALGRDRSVSLKPEGGPATLTARHRLLASYMVDGCPHADICARILIKRATTIDGEAAVVTRHPRPHEPLTLVEAADLLRIRRRNARELASFPIFKAEYERQLRNFREGERAANLHRMVAVRDDPGASKAADRKVQLTAAMALLGEAGNSTSLSVNINNGVQVAGLVIDLREDDEIEPATIEHEDHR